jgi:hypothetical protein
MVLSTDTTTSKEHVDLRASLPGVSLVQISPDFGSEGLDSVCNMLHTMDMADIRQSILDRMRELGWTINHVSVLVKDRIPRRTVYTYLTGQVDARTEVASVLMEVLGLTITSKQSVKRARRPRKESGE